MTETERKALALVNEVLAELEGNWTPRTKPFGHEAFKALCRAIEQHEAFRREVSDAVEEYADRDTHAPITYLGRFILPKPDPLVEAWQMAFPGNHIEDARDECAKISAAIEKRGGKIVWGERQ